jgi:predicted RNase H-like nuclease (RuvC/YqgF family)
MDELAERDARIAYLEHVNQDLQAIVEDLERRNERLWRELGALRVEKAKTSSPGLNTHLAPHSGPLKALGRVLQYIRSRIGRNGP